MNILSNTSPQSEGLEQAGISDALQLVLPDADHLTLQRVATAACRAVYFVPVSPSQHAAHSKQALFNSLRTAGASITTDQLDFIHDLILRYNAAAETSSLFTASTQPQLSAEDFEALIPWNSQTALIRDQVLLSSHAGIRHIEQVPTVQVSKSPKGSSNVSASLPESEFSASWLRHRCTTLPSVKAGTLTPSEMALSVHALLIDPSMSDEAIQGHLFDALAGDFDAVADILSKRDLIRRISDAIIADCSHAAQLELLDLSSTAPRQRGVSARRSGPHAVGRLAAQVTIRDRSQDLARKTLDRESKKLAKAGLLQSNQEAEVSLLQPSLSGSAFEERQKAFPGVEVDRDSAIGAVDHLSLPKGSTREVGKGYEEIFVPPPVQSPGSRKLVEISSAFAEHPELLAAMSGVTRLNRLQSTVYPVAFGSDENLLVCAPTGAGKTNVALLTILKEIVAVKRREQRSFKVVYVAPMKALAAEVADKFQKRLSALRLRVREFTGDMSLSRSEAMETHVLVTTPEKWDVVTRKSGSDLGDAVTLFIVDEIHLLHDDRGAVLESIVARTLRLSETAQRRIRLVGLSATLPNYADVGSFMRVNPQKGLFHFDNGHRPVPLSQTFIGISEGGTSNSKDANRRRQDKMHEMAWKKVKDSLQRGHQAMIFVHSRKGTSSAAREMLSRATQDACENLFIGMGNNQSTSRKSLNLEHEDMEQGPPVALPSWASKEISKSKTYDIRELCIKGLGIHNAGLPRSDRKLVEKLFAEGVIRLLCCTATLAWGINLPARTVVIMGTQVYSAEKGGFVQLGMLDVMQIFGRAGRPQFDTEGEGTIITMHEHLGKYLSMLTSSIPIESQLGASSSRLADHLNAEVVSGTVSSIGEGVRWLSYTYLSVRMPKNPLVYGIDRSEVEADLSLHSHRANLIESAAKALDDAKMCRYDPRTGALAPTDLGRVSSHFYVSHETIVMWNEALAGFATEAAIADQEWDCMYASVLHAISCATEFEQMRSRQEEEKELDQLAREACPLPLKAGSETREGKVSILLQAHISRAVVRMSDLSYIIESATRLLRAFFEISLRKGLPSLSLAALELARASESRIWPFQHPLWQFTGLVRRTSGFIMQAETVAMIESTMEDNDILSLRGKSKEELSIMVRAPKMVSSVQKILKSIPILEIEKAAIAPLSRSVLSVDVSLFPNFRWNDSLHGKMESWWLWIEDLEENRIYHSQKIILSKRQVQSLAIDYFSGASKRTVSYKFTVPVFDPPSMHYWVRIESDRWHTGRSSKVMLSLGRTDLPTERTYKSSLLDLRPLPVQAVLGDDELDLFENDVTHLTPVQTRIFHVAYHSDENMLISAPASSGMEFLAYFAIYAALKKRPTSTIVYFCPDIHALELRRRWLEKLTRRARKPIYSLDPQSLYLRPKDLSSYSIVITTPEVWYPMTKKWSDLEICTCISLVVFEELHSLIEEQETTERIITRIRRAPQSNFPLNQAQTEATRPRIVALMAVVPNAAQIGEWIGASVEKGLLCFGPEVKEVPCELQVLGVAGDRFSSRMYSLNRPLFAMIQRYSLKKPALVFVASRRQALLTAQDLLRMASLDNAGDFVGKAAITEEMITRKLRSVNDASVKRSLSKGVALYHEKMSYAERKTVEELYRCGYAQIMITTFALTRAFDARSHLVIVKGTECFDHLRGRYEDISCGNILHMIGKAGRPRKDQTGHAIVFVHEPKKTLVKKLLHEPLPTESQLLISCLPSILNDLISSHSLCTISCILDWLRSTFFYQRLGSNPGFYGVTKERNRKKRDNAESSSTMRVHGEFDQRKKGCERLIFEAIDVLKKELCLVTSEDQLKLSTRVVSTALGYISAAHGVSIQSVRHIASSMEHCQTFEGIVNMISECDEIASSETQHRDEKQWGYMVDIITEEFCATRKFKSSEEVCQALDISGWKESPRKRTRVLCYSLLVDAKLKAVAGSSLQGVFYRRFRQLLNAGFEIAAEFGALSALRAFVTLSQCVTQGLPPTADIWMICASEDKELNAKGRETGWVGISKIVERLEDFNIFLTRHCKSESERTTIFRRVQRYPRITILQTESKRNGYELVVDVSTGPKKPDRKFDANSKVANRGEGGFVLIASYEDSGEVVTVQRFMESSVPREGTNECPTRLHIAAPDRRGWGSKRIQIWIASDALIGVEASVVVSVGN